MMEIEAVMIRRRGIEDDPHAEVVVSIQDIHGEWREVGTEVLSSNFSHIWSLPSALQSPTPMEIVAQLAPDRMGELQMELNRRKHDDL